MARDRVDAYARAVVAGRIVTGRPVRLACERHLRDRKTAKERGLEWRKQKAQDAIDFFADCLVLEDGSPFRLEDYQAFIVGSLFGWYKADGFRRYRDAYVEMGKGSGKSPLAAGIGLFMLIADGEPAPEVYSAATTQDQARIVWRDASRMVEQNPELDAVVKREAACLSFGKPEGVFRPVSSEHKGLDGKRVHGGLIDELHEHRDAMVVDKIRAGTKRRRNALVFRITNSGFDRTSVCWKEHDFSIKVLEGTVQNESWFAYVCALDEGDEWTDPAVWPKTNPGLAVGLPPLSYLREQVASAVGMPSKENIVKRLNFCIWTEQSERWLPMSAWDACPQDAVDADALRGRPCMMAFDGAFSDDFAASCKVFEPDEEGAFPVLWRFWLPEASLAAGSSKRSEAVRLQFREWANQGWITLHEGNTVDLDLIEEELLKDCETYDVRKVALDRYGIKQLIGHLKDSLGEDRVIDFPQNMAGMTDGSKKLEKVLADGKLRHGRNPVARYMAANATVKHGPNAQKKPEREASGDKIDGIVALIMGLDCWSRDQGADVQPSVYAL